VTAVETDQSSSDEPQQRQESRPSRRPGHAGSCFNLSDGDARFTGGGNLDERVMVDPVQAASGRKKRRFRSRATERLHLRSVVRDPSSGAVDVESSSQPETEP